MGDGFGAPGDASVPVYAYLCSMLGKLTGWEDTIVALATPPGVGAIGVIRVSGREAIKIVAALWPAKDLLQQESHTLHVGVLKEGEEALDEVESFEAEGNGNSKEEDEAIVQEIRRKYIHHLVHEGWFSFSIPLLTSSC